MIIRRIFSWFRMNILWWTNSNAREHKPNFDFSIDNVINIFCIFSLIRKTHFVIKSWRTLLINIKILNYGKFAN